VQYDEKVNDVGGTEFDLAEYRRAVKVDNNRERDNMCKLV